MVNKYVQKQQRTVICTKKKKLFATFCFDNINAPYAKYFMRQAYSEGSRVEGKF